MPLFQYILSDFDTQIAVWKISESNDELLDLLHLDAQQLLKYHSLSYKRQREYLGTRACMEHLSLDHHKIKYKSSGKPFLEGDSKISFSHSHGMAAVGISNFNIGVDIEMKRNEKIRKIRPKFVRPDEDAFIKEEYEIDYLQVIWGIKESLYKVHDGNLYSFKNHYKVEPFHTFFEVPIRCSILDKEQQYFTAYYYEFNNYYLTFVLDNCN